jgi:hypothetical protein
MRIHSLAAIAAALIAASFASSNAAPPAFGLANLQIQPDLQFVEADKEQVKPKISKKHRGKKYKAARHKARKYKKTGYKTKIYKRTKEKLETPPPATKKPGGTKS